MASSISSFLTSIPLFTPSTPFGPFQPLHEYVIASAQPISSSNWYMLFLVPTFPLYLQALLMPYEGTRVARSALGAVGIVMLVQAGLSYRFTQPWLNALNNGLGVGYLHLIARYVEFGLIRGPVIDRYFKRHPLLAALDITFNARWIGLGGLDLDHQRQVKVGSGHRQPGHSGQANSNTEGAVDDADADALDVHVAVPDGGFQINGHTIPDMRSRETWLPWPKVRRTRFQAVRRHVSIAFCNYVIFDTFLSLIRDFGSDTVGSTSAVPDALYRFSHENTFVILPFLSLPSGKGLFTAAPWAIELATIVAVATGVWLGIASGYHAFAAIFVGSGFWETESWEMDLFDHPLKADSLIDFWGKRWHQFFRHHFILTSTLFLRAVGLPITSPLILTMSFLLSGAMHAIGQLTMSPYPDLMPVFILFPLSGLGCFAEVQFKRLTGRKVRGVWGRIWVWAFMVATGRLGAKAWLESGVGGSYLMPPWAGEYVKDWLKDWVVDKV